MSKFASCQPRQPGAPGQTAPSSEHGGGEHMPTSTLRLSAASAGLSTPPGLNCSFLHQSPTRPRHAIITPNRAGQGLSAQMPTESSRRSRLLTHLFASAIATISSVVLLQNALNASRFSVSGGMVNPQCQLGRVSMPPGRDLGIYLDSMLCDLGSFLAILQ
jgi:hypothetical protein